MIEEFFKKVIRLVIALPVMDYLITLLLDLLDDDDDEDDDEEEDDGN